ncbi:MAG: hypothetical protein ACYTG3_18135 [Planctomycetota bacterium]
MQEEELEIRAPPVEPKEPETPGIEVPPGDPFLRGLFPDSPAGYGVVVLVVICAVLVFRKFLRRPRPKDIG